MAARSTSIISEDDYEVRKERVPVLCSLFCCCYTSVSIGIQSALVWFEHVVELLLCLPMLDRTYVMFNYCNPQLVDDHLGRVGVPSNCWMSSS